MSLIDLFNDFIKHQSDLHEPNKDFRNVMIDFMGLDASKTKEELLEMSSLQLFLNILDTDTWKNLSGFSMKQLEKTLESMKLQSKMESTKENVNPQLFDHRTVDHTMLNSNCTVMQTSTKNNKIGKKICSRQLSVYDSNTETIKTKKIALVITEEQRQLIEKSYMYDKSIINDTEISSRIIKKSSENKTTFVCKLCKKIYGRLDKCQVHVLNHLNVRPFLCRFNSNCEYKTVTVSNVKVHIQKVHLKLKPYKCSYCIKTYYTLTNCEDHERKHSDEKPFACNNCDFKCKNKHSLRNHIVNLHLKISKNFKCNVCHKSFHLKNQLQTHKVIHDKSKRFKCQLCSSYLKTTDSLEKHMERSHQQNYKCDTCEKSFKSKKMLNSHKLVHSAPKYTCPHCSNAYKSKHSLNEHIAVKHEKKLLYKCKICGKKSNSSSNLATHMAVHSDKTIQCEGCKKMFKDRKDNLKQHQKNCKAILENPELHYLLSKKQINFSKNETARSKIKK